MWWNRQALSLALCGLGLSSIGCSSEPATDSMMEPVATVQTPPTVSPPADTATPGGMAMDGAGAMAPTPGVMDPPPAPMGAAGEPAMDLPPADDAMDGVDMTDMGGGAPTPLGPEDGDPSAPIIAIPEVACGGPMGGFGLGSPNHQLDGRDMIVTYPCNKHAGAPATFFLNLHGTTPVSQHFYQHGYFAAHQYAESHNLIVVTPSSVVMQWGNGDNGEDEPHLMNVIEWVYANLDGPDKFDIRGMWVGGHSWGGGYTARFGCLPELADRVRGLVLMSGGGVGGFGGAACADSVSVIISMAEGDGRMPSDQASVAAGHGCEAAQTEMILDNVHTYWAGCDPGFVHANYYMLGKEHATFMDDEAVLSIVDWIKLGRQ
ncbi:MAG: hypothetical protein OXT09_08640 [Myxococcales bacterium]|nr:hypothetical protein [Myxococcales bacterium]